MSVALRYLTLQEVSGMTEKLASMMPLMIQLEASRAAESDRRAKIKLVED